MNSLDEVEAGLLLSKFSIENIPEELVDDDSMMTNRKTTNPPKRKTSGKTRRESHASLETDW